MCVNSIHGINYKAYENNDNHNNDSYNNDDMYVYIYISIYTYIHTYVYIYIYTHTCNGMNYKAEGLGDYKGIGGVARGLVKGIRLHVRQFDSRYQLQG